MVLPLAALATAVLLLLWDVGLAGRLARVAEAPRSWATLTAVTGLLLLPAVLIRVLGASLVDGRTVSALGWLWPVVLTLATLQAGLTLSKGLGARTLVTPILVYNGIVTVSAWIEFAAGRGVLLPSVLHAMPTALAGAIGYLAGPAALWSPLAFAPPLIAPAYRARWAVNATVRGAVALYALATIVAFSSELPQAIRGVQSFTQWTLAPLRERPADTPLLIGARILPVVRGTPSPVALRYDTDLIDSADVNVIAVTVAPAGATPRALDSLARTLESYRADSALLAVTIGWDALEMLRARFAPTAWERDRLSVVDQVMRRLRPDVLIPVSDPLGRGAQVVGQRSVRAWVPTLTAAARTAHVVRPRTRVLVEVSTFDTRDSVMVAWATQAGSGQDGVAYMLQPGFRGGVTLEARMQAIDRWRRLRQVQRPGASAQEWVTLAGGFPWTQGEVAQDRAVWGVLAWASARPGIGAVLVGDGGDYDTRRGLRGPGGRLRIATTSLRRAARSLRDAAR